MNYTDVQKLFGTPLQHVPKPHIPYKPKTSHWIFGIVGVTFMVIGMVHSYKFVASSFNYYSKKEN